MSSWLHSDRRGPRSWKRSWTARLLSSSSLPPARLLAFSAIVLFFLSVSSYVDYKAIERRAEIGVRVFAAPLAVMTAFVLFAVLRYRRRYWTLRRPPTAYAHRPAAHHQDGGSPWGIALAVVVLLLMVSFQSSVHSMWFRPLWGSDYYS